GEESLLALASTLQLGKALHWHTHFIPPAAVADYFNACDLVVQPYREATQSGVTPLAYHFEKPVVVTRVGALPEMVEADQSGWVAAPNAIDLAQQLRQTLSTPLAPLQANIRAAKEKYSWESFCRRIVSLSTETKP
ncbi:MAG: glycosyltransferase, partial [Sphingobacteriia bacterium]